MWMSSLGVSFEGSGLDRLPPGRVVRNLDGSLGGAANPGQGHAVEGAGGAEIDVDPLLAAARAHPCTAEVVRSGGVYFLVFVVEKELGDLPRI